MRKCKGIREISVMEMAQVGVMTRARALAVATVSSETAKRRKAGTSGGELKFSPSLVRLRNRRSVSPPASRNSKRRRTVVDSRCSSSSSGSVPASCCSSNGSSSLAKESLNSVDLKEESCECERSTYNDGGERRETTPTSELRPESDKMESTAKPTEDNSRQRSSPKKMPSESQLEEFFAASDILQKELLEKYKEKYNFDFEKEQPLEGPFEWVRLKP